MNSYLASLVLVQSLLTISLREFKSWLPNITIAAFNLIGQLHGVHRQPRVIHRQAYNVPQQPDHGSSHHNRSHR